MLDSDLKTLILQNNKMKAIELYMGLTGKDLRETETHIDNLSKSI